MAYPPHALVALQGINLATDMSAEVWQCGIRVSTHDPSGGYLADPQAYANVIGPLLQTWFNGNGAFSSYARLNMVKVNNIKPDGHYKDTTTHQVPVVATGGTAPSFPGFCSLAATLETGHTTGTARRGRIYLPTANSLAANTAVSVTSSAALALRDTVKAMLLILLRNEPTGGLLVNPVIASKINGNYNDISAVSVNTVVDVQRRRKNRVRGTRTASVSLT